MARQLTRPRSRTRSDTGKLWWAIFFAIVTAAAAGFGLYVWLVTPAPVVRDPVTLCPATDPPDIIVVLLDTTDGLPPPAKDEVFRYLSDAVEASPPDALLDVRALDPAYRSGRPLLTLCNPGDGKGISEFTGNPALAKKRWREKFHGPILRALEGGLNQAPSKTSPLLATLQGIAIDRFTGGHAAAARKSLTIVSDMREYTPGYSQYNSDLSYRHFKSLPLYQKVRTNLHGAQVTIFYIQRGIGNSASHIRFWADWVADNNGQWRKAVKLQGAGKS